MAKRKQLFTIGYEQTPPKAVLDELESAGVKLLVDVRAVTPSLAPSGLFEEPALGKPRRSRHRVSASQGPRHAERGPARGTQRPI